MSRPGVTFCCVRSPVAKRRSRLNYENQSDLQPLPFPKSPALTAALAAAGLIGGAQAQLHTAGNLLVNIDATTLSVGPLNFVPNAGTMGGFFEARGGGAAVPDVAPVNGNGTKGIHFNGASFMQHVSTVGGAFLLADPTLTGPNPTCTIEAWAFNPSVAQEEPWWPGVIETAAMAAICPSTTVHTAPSGRSVTGAVPTLAGMIWGRSQKRSVAPLGLHFRWHHHSRLCRWCAPNSENAVLNTWGTTPISLATQMNNDAGVPTDGLRGP